MSNFVSTRILSIAMLLGALTGISMIYQAANHHDQPVDGPFPSDFPKAIAREIMADIDADPEPAETTSLMSFADADALTASPGERTPLDVCRARRAVMYRYLMGWPRMPESQRQTISALAETWGDDVPERCSAVFDKANGYALAARRAKLREAVQARLTEIVEATSPAPANYPTRQVSAADCQWWRDQIDIDRRNASRAGSRDLREGWDHNEQQAQNAYRNLCQ